MMVVDLPCHQTKVAITGLVLPPIHPIHPIPQYGFPQVWTNLMLQGRRTDNTMGFQIFYDTSPIEACATVRCESQFDFQFDTFIIIFSYMITRNLI